VEVKSGKNQATTGKPGGCVYRESDVPEVSRKCAELSGLLPIYSIFYKFGERAVDTFVKYIYNVT
jgi:hypothetical protein